MDVHPTVALLQDLQQRLEFRQTEEDSACGEVSGYPVTMTVLGAEPLSLMFAFWTGSREDVPIELPERLQSFADGHMVGLSFEDGFSWLSLYDLTGQSAESIHELLTAFAETLTDAGLAAPVGCVACGSEETAELTLLEGRAVRLCPGCGGRLFEERERREEELNRTAAWHALALPMVCFYVACGWAGFWLLIDYLLRLTAGVIWINFFTVLLAIGVLGAVGFVLGKPVGGIVRRSGLSKLSPAVVSVAVVALLSLFGEILYIAIARFLISGVLNLILALWIFLPVVWDYPVGFLIAKLLTAGAIAIGCHQAATAKKTVSLTAIGLDGA